MNEILAECGSVILRIIFISVELQLNLLTAGAFITNLFRKHAVYGCLHSNNNEHRRVVGLPGQLLQGNMLRAAIVAIRIAHACVTACKV
jgi:hypothetical protein